MKQLYMQVSILPASELLITVAMLSADLPTDPQTNYVHIYDFCLTSVHFHGKYTSEGRNPHGDPKERVL
ncbi:hypothetical protein EYF80_035408 [Liparis tanakae]|uniref:Uncharacterized protein n=1 Tax=Liparis tanakae TaxID=230148 RepID=A0A4Z2GMD9_9TELE|nr:hypothetical protein EYF80_035408 [Liparis tanakae]